jgi:nicotinamidase-related amidase
LKQALADLSPSAVFVVGMPLEFAVRFMALEAAILCRNVYVIEDACW